MRRIELIITFTDENGAMRRESQTFETSYAPDHGGEHRIAHMLFAELKVSVEEQPVPKHNATALEWLNPRDQPAGLERFFDIQNSKELWRELASLIMGAEGDLYRARMFKSLEPLLEPSFDDNVAINDLYYLHDRKMNLLNESVYALIKVQELVYRLLHESLGDDLFDTSKANWETTQLKPDKVEKGLEAKRASGQLSQAEFDAITQALALPTSTSKAQITRDYRNRLTHHIRPSVDYPMFFSALESRVGEELKSPQGRVIGEVHTLRNRPRVQYKFEDLHAAFSEYLDAVVAMLHTLNQIDILRLR